MPAGFFFFRTYRACGLIYDNVLFFIRACLREFIVPAGLFTLF